MGKRKQKTNKQKSKKKLWLWILAVVVFIVAALVVYWRVDTYVEGVRYEEDRQRFMRVKEDIETLTAELNKVDENIQWKSEATCRRSSVKYGEGLATCRVATQTEVIVKKDEKAEALIATYNKVFQDEAQRLKITPTRDYEASGHSPFFPKNLEPGSSGQGFWSNSSDMVCGSLYYIEDTHYGATPSDRLLMSFACNDGAEDTWFHVPTTREILDEAAKE